jgi:hypothetical protein
LLQLKEVKKEEKSKLKLLEAEITKIRAEIKKIESKKIQKINETRSQVF